MEIRKNYFDVSQFGAIPNNSKSMHAAWEEIRKRAKSLPLGTLTEIYFPAGFWRCRDPLWIDWNAVDCHGAGSDKTSLTVSSGSGSIALLAGFARTPNGKSFPAENRPLMGTGILDGSLSGYAYRLGAGHHLAAQGTVADMGIAQWAGFYDASGVRREPVRKLTIEVALAWHGSIPQGIQLCGLLDSGLGPYYERKDCPGCVRPWSLWFDEFDRQHKPVPEFPVLIFSLATHTGPEPDGERGYVLDVPREWEIDLNGHQKDAPFRLAIQVDLNAATVSAYIDNIQVPTNPRWRTDESSGWKANTDLRLVRNETVPFKIGAEGQRLTALKGGPVDARGEFTVYGMSVSTDLRYQNNGPGTPLTRMGTGTVPQNDRWRYVDSNGPDTAPCLWYLDTSLVPDCDGRIARIVHGRHSKVNTARDTSFLCDSSDNAWQNPAYPMMATIKIRDMDIMIDGHGMEDRCGSAISVYQTLEVTVERCRIHGGCYGYQSLRGDCSYPVVMDDLFAEGWHASIFGVRGKFIIGYLHVGIPNLYGCYFFGCDVSIDRLVSSGWNGRHGHSLIKSTPCEWGHTLDIGEIWDDTEAGPDPVEGIVVMSRADAASCGRLIIDRISCGYVGPGASIVSLRGNTSQSGFVSRFRVGIVTLGAMSPPPNGIVHSDTPYWEGTVEKPATWYGRPQEPVFVYTDRFRTGVANAKVQVLG